MSRRKSVNKGKGEFRKVRQARLCPQPSSRATYADVAVVSSVFIAIVLGDLARQAVRALDAGAAAPAPRPRLEDWRRFGPALLPPRVGPWVDGVEVDVRAAEVAVRAVAAAA